MQPENSGPSGSERKMFHCSNLSHISVSVNRLWKRQKRSFFFFYFSQKYRYGMCSSKERVNFSNRNWNARASNFLSPVTYKDLNQNRTNSMLSIKITLSNNRHIFLESYTTCSNFSFLNCHSAIQPNPRSSFLFSLTNTLMTPVRKLSLPPNSEKNYSHN